MIDAKDKKDLIDEIMKTLKTQADRRRELLTKKSVDINPQQLATTNPSTYGPYYFETTVQNGIPYIAFGQVRQQQTRIKGALVVAPYVDTWELASGGIAGFTLGVYALTPVPAALDKHTITWIASAKASLYKADSTYDNWSQKYDSSAATYLHSAPGDFESAR